MTDVRGQIAEDGGQTKRSGDKANLSFDIGNLFYKTSDILRLSARLIPPAKL